MKCDSDFILIYEGGEMDSTGRRKSVLLHAGGPSPVSNRDSNECEQHKLCSRCIIAEPAFGLLFPSATESRRSDGIAFLPMAVRRKVKDVHRSLASLRPRRFAAVRDFLRTSG